MCECCSHGTHQHTSHLYVQGVNCEGCLGEITKALEKVPGIVAIEHLPISKEAKVSFDNRLADRERLKKIINLIGFAIQ